MEIQTRDGLVRVLANQYQQIFASGLRSETHNSGDLKNHNFKGLHLTIDVTAETAGGSTHTIVVTIQGKDPVSGKYYTILASANITATGTTILKVYPGITAAANASVSDVLPADWRVLVTHTADGASNMTYSISASMLN